MASRRELPIPLARLRAEGVVSELREGELALTRAKAATLLRGAGLGLARDDVDAVFRATEGWPAALSLAVRAVAGQPAPGPAAVRFGGADRRLRSTCGMSCSPSSRRRICRSRAGARSSTC